MEESKTIKSDDNHSGNSGMTVEEWLNGEQLSVDIWHGKYQQGDETFEQWLDRVSGGNQHIRQLIKEQKFIFAGRILSNRGVTDRKITYSNCYCLTPPQDSLESIFEAGSKLARTFSYGGGSGVDVSNLRPKNAPVNNAAKSTSGTVSFMDFYSYITGLIGQEGRRGALMISISCEHPDLIEFINLKADLDICTKANISVRVTNAFMQAVESNSDFKLHFTMEDGSEITRIVNAREVFMLLAKRNWEMAEPGILYWDRISDYNLLQGTGFKYAGVNPCLVGETLIQTVEGEIPIKDLVNTTPYVYCMDDNGKLTIRKAIKVWKTRENAKLVKVVTGKGTIICTPDHRIFTTNRGWVPAESLKKNDKIKGLNRQTTGHKYCSVGLSGTGYEKEHRFVARHFFDLPKGFDVHHINDNGFDNRLSNLDIVSHKKHSQISNQGRVIEVNRDSSNGQYLPKDVHTPRDCKRLGKQVGNNWFVYSVEELDYTADVYDMTVEDTHNFVANGMVVHNCAEEPLPAGGSCLLGSINLSKFVKNPFTDYPLINYDELAKTVERAIYALNDVLMEGLPLHPLQEQRDSVAGWRQIGLGTMGLGDLLLMCSKKYGAPESIPVITKIYHLIASTAVKTSLQLAKDNECFPNCTPEIKKAMVECDFIRNLDLPKEVLDDIKEYGLFNSQLLTCAPTGTIGTMLQVSTGVEPNYAFSYNRRTVSLNKEETVYKVDTKIVADYKKVTGNDTLPDYFVSSEQIPYEQRIEVQASLQRFIDASISSTVNLPNSTTVDDVANLYLLAWKKGLKGITIWRDGCQRQAILTKENREPEEQPTLKRGEILKASDDLVGKKRTLQTGCGTLHLSAWFDKNTGELVETFFSKGSTGGCALFMTGLSRMTSLAARAGAPIDAIVDQLLSSGTCPSYAVRNATKKDTSKGSSCPVAIGYALMEMYKDVQSQIEVNKALHGHWAYNKAGEETQEQEGNIESPKCPKCGEPIQMVEGCMTCPLCGYSKCS